eukprot:gene7562-5334_t
MKTELLITELLFIITSFVPTSSLCHIPYQLNNIRHLFFVQISVDEYYSLNLYTLSNIKYIKRIHKYITSTTAFSGGYLLFVLIICIDYLFLFVFICICFSNTFGYYVDSIVITILVFRSVLLGNVIGIRIDDSRFLLINRYEICFSDFTLIIPKMILYSKVFLCVFTSVNLVLSYLCLLNNQTKILIYGKQFSVYRFYFLLEVKSPLNGFRKIRTSSGIINNFIEGTF